MLARKAIRKCFAENKRGVSPVIANVILAAAVIAVGMTVLVWATNSFGAHQSEADTFFFTRSEAMKESLVIEDVWFDEEGALKYVNVTVRNVGTVSLKIEAIYIYMDGEEVWKIDSKDEGQWIEVGKAVTIRIDFPWVEGQYYILVATTRGNQVRECYSISG